MLDGAWCSQPNGAPVSPSPRLPGSRHVFRSPLRIAAGCRHHALARTAVKLGCIDPLSSQLSDIVAAASSAEGGLWSDSPAVCAATTTLVHEAMAGWSPARHFLYYRGVRVSIRFLLLAAERLRRQLLSQTATLPELPTELWLYVCSFPCRKDWPVPG